MDHNVTQLMPSIFTRSKILPNVQKNYYQSETEFICFYGRDITLFFIKRKKAIFFKTAFYPTKQF
jgi:hypothetical protein